MDYQATIMLYQLALSRNFVPQISPLIINQLKQLEKSMQISSSDNLQAPKRGYSRISLRKKAMLVKLIYRKSASFEDAIAQLGIKKTTAINILKRYKETGSFPVRRYRKTIRKSQDQPIIKIQQPIVKVENQASKHTSDELIKQEDPRGEQPCVYPPGMCWVYYPAVYYAGY